MSTRPPAVPRRLDDESGLSLLEVVMAIFMLSVALLAIASVATSSLASIAQTRDREQATNVASAAIEDVRSRDFADIVHAPGDVDPAALPPGLDPAIVGAACFSMDDPAGERIVEGVADDPVPFERVGGDADDFTVHTIITFEDVACGSTDQSELKRVTTIASWSAGSSREIVVQQTLVTDVGRGLPVPRFEIRPEDATARFFEPSLTDPMVSDKRQCTEHVLRNLGAQDSYDWELVETSAGDTVSYEPVHDAYDAGGWRVTAFLEADAPSEAREGSPPASDADRMSAQSGFPRLVSDLRVDSGSSALLTVCSEPRGTVDPLDIPSPVTMGLAIHSRFDERQQQPVLHRVAVGAADPGDVTIPGSPLYLFEDPDDTRHDRDFTRNGIMGPLAAADAGPNVIDRLSTHDYTPDVANWSTNVVSSDDLSGVRLVYTAGPVSNPGVSQHTATWHYQFKKKTRIERDATVVLWVAPAEALTGSSDGLPMPMRLQIRLDELQNETSSVWSADTVDWTYVHTTPLSASTKGWQRVVVPVDLGAVKDFNNNRFLRLRVTCVEPLDPLATPRDCNLAYDNEAFGSAVYIEER